MMKIRNNTKRLRASTLVEMLVVMILSSIILTLITDGLTIFRQHTIKVGDGITANGQLTDSYMLLENICQSTDSVSVDGENRLRLYRKDRSKLILTCNDSLIIAVRDERSDTLFTRATSLKYITDSIEIKLHNKEAIVRLTFRIGVPINTNNYEEIEKKYGYE